LEPKTCDFGDWCSWCASTEKPREPEVEAPETDDE